MRGALLVVAAGLMWSFFTGLLVRNAPRASTLAVSLLSARPGWASPSFCSIVLPDVVRFCPRLFKLGWQGILASVPDGGRVHLLRLRHYEYERGECATAGALCTPILSAIIGFLVLGERLNRGMLIAVVIGLIGLGVMVNGAVGGGNMFGNVMALASARCFSPFIPCCSETNPPG